MYQVYTNLFPARHTWYLLATIIILNGIDWAGFELLAIGNTEIEKLSTGYRVLDGLFQALGLSSRLNSCSTYSTNVDMKPYELEDFMWLL